MYEDEITKITRYIDDGIRCRMLLDASNFRPVDWKVIERNACSAACVSLKAKEIYKSSRTDKV